MLPVVGAENAISLFYILHNLEPSLWLSPVFSSHLSPIPVSEALGPPVLGPLVAVRALPAQLQGTLLRTRRHCCRGGERLSLSNHAFIILALWLNKMLTRNLT